MVLSENCEKIYLSNAFYFFEAVWGASHWQSEMSRALGVGDRTIRRWARGDEERVTRTARGDRRSAGATRARPRRARASPEPHRLQATASRQRREPEMTDRTTQKR